jgi:ribosomal protein S18 acetylase RimI-like enzyme
MNVIIRQATEADFDPVGRIFADENKFHADLLPDRFQIADPIMTREWFHEIIGNENKALLVADLNNELVGLILIELRTNPDDPIFVPRRYAYVDEVAVTTSQRGQGIGRLLMAQAHEWIVAQGVKEVELNVWESNTGAIAFYEELGYQPLRRRLRFLLD